MEGRSVRLGLLEIRLLWRLASPRGAVHSRDSLLETVWKQCPATGQPRNVDSAIKRLRRKLGPAGDCIETVRGAGYRIRDKWRSAVDSPWLRAVQTAELLTERVVGETVVTLEGTPQPARMEMRALMPPRWLREI